MFWIGHVDIYNFLLRMTDTVTSQNIGIAFWDTLYKELRYNYHSFLSRVWRLAELLKSYPYNRPWRPIGLWDVETPTFSRQSAHRWRWCCQPYAPAVLYPPGRFLVLLSVRGWVDFGPTMLLEGSGQLKNQMISSGFEPAIFLLVFF
jgi:hypothetical protein